MQIVLASGHVEWGWEWVKVVLWEAAFSGAVESECESESDDVSKQELLTWVERGDITKRGRGR